MNYQSATIVLIILYMVLILYFVIKGAKQTKSMKDFALGMGFSPVIVGLSLAASITSAATFIINPGFVAVYGWSAFLALSIVLPIGLFASLIVLSKSLDCVDLFHSKIKNLSEPKVSDKKTDTVISEEITIVEENEILATQSVLPEENV